ncbi:MAG: flagellar protein [Ruminococcus sp.]|jgi:flagellar operon protein|nr:flagellar protein [Ruminococcus sp.]
MEIDNLLINRVSQIRPITTGTPVTRNGETTPQTEAPKQSFNELLRDKINSQSGLNFSKHAIKRVAEREIGIESEEQIDKLSQGFKIAEQKGLSNALILTDTSAFIVNVKNNTVITAIGKSEMQGNVFTNIDGAVIM